MQSSSLSSDKECKFYVRLDGNHVVSSLSNRDKNLEEPPEPKILSPDRMSNMFGMSSKRKKLNLLGDELIDESGIKNDSNSKVGLQSNKHPLLAKHRQVLESVRATLAAGKKPTNFKSISLEDRLPNRHLEALIEASNKINTHHDNTKLLRDLENKLKWTSFARNSPVSDSFGNKSLSDALTLSKRHNNQLAFSPWKTQSSSVRSFQSSTPFIPPTPISSKKLEQQTTSQVREESAKKNLREELKLSSSVAGDLGVDKTDDNFNNPCLNFFEQETSNMLSVLDSILADQDNTEVEEVLANWPLTDDVNSAALINEEEMALEPNRIELDEESLDFMPNVSTKSDWTSIASQDCLDGLTMIVIRISHKLLELNNSSLRAKIDQVFKLENPRPEVIKYLKEINNQKKKIVEMLNEINEQKMSSDRASKHSLFIKTRHNLEKSTLRSDRDELRMFMHSCYEELNINSNEIVQLDKSNTMENRVDKWAEFFNSYLNEFKLMFHDMLDELFFDPSVKQLLSLATSLETRLIKDNVCGNKHPKDPRTGQITPVDVCMIGSKVDKPAPRDENHNKILKYKKQLATGVLSASTDTERVIETSSSPESVRDDQERSSLKCVDLTDITKIDPVVSTPSKTMAFLDERPDDSWLYSSCSSSVRSSPPRTPVLHFDDHQVVCSQISIIDVDNQLTRSQEITSSPLSPPVAPPTPLPCSFQDSLDQSASTLASLNVSDSFHLVLESDNDESCRQNTSVSYNEVFDDKELEGLVESMVSRVEKETSFLNKSF